MVGYRQKMGFTHSLENINPNDGNIARIMPKAQKQNLKKINHETRAALHHQHVLKQGLT
jgi:hypothetical protein